MKSTVFENFIDTIHDGVNLFVFLTKRRLKTIEEMNSEIQLMAPHKTIHVELTRILNNLKVYNVKAVKSEIYNEAKNDEQIMSRILKAYKFRIKDTAELLDRVNFLNPQKMTFFYEHKDNETEVNKINIKLYELFSIISINLINWNAMEQEINEFIGDEPQPEQPEPPNTLPKELGTNEAKAILQKAIKAGLCDNNYSWKDTIQLLAYFADRVSHRLNLTSKMDKDGNVVTLWKPFETLFDYKGKKVGKSKLRGAKQNWMRLNTRFEPTGYEKVDILFE